MKVKHFLSLKNDDFEFSTILARAGARAARSNYFLEKFNTSAFTGKKIRSKAPLGNVLECFEGLCAYVDNAQRSTLRPTKFSDRGWTPKETRKFAILRNFYWV